MKTLLIITLGMCVLFAEIWYITHYQTTYKAVCRAGTAQLVQDTRQGDFEYLGPLDEGRLSKRVADDWCLEHDYRAMVVVE